MRLCWYWPIYGLDDEVAFTFSRSRGSQHLLESLEWLTGTVLSDGHSAYRSYAKAVTGTVHAQCWTHTRREFVKAENHEPLCSHVYSSSWVGCTQVEGARTRDKVDAACDDQYVADPG